MPRALIIGGSLGGLMAGLILRQRGFEVSIFERTATPLAGRGAGIVSHRMLVEALGAAGIRIPEGGLGVPVTERRVLGRDGAVIHRLPFPQVLTSWDRLFQILRAACPDGAYHLGAAFTGAEEADGRVIARFADGSSADGDLLVGADGLRSAVRGIVAPGSEPSYAGYVAWRGMVDEHALSPAAHASLFDSFAFCLPEGEQMLGYPVAGPDNDLRPGHRRYNVVWYRPAPEGPALDDLLTDGTGKRHAGGIPPPLIRPDVIAAMRHAAQDKLAPAFAEIMERTEGPFFQPIHDYAAPRLASGRMVLMGDAAFVARPHVGAGVAKAGADAHALADALTGAADIPAGLRQYEVGRLAPGNRIIARARELGAYMQAQQASPAERAAAAANRTPEAVALHTASLAFLVADC